jgi:DNA-3-methyladenine glycosylase
MEPPIAQCKKMRKKLTRGFYSRPTLQVARELLGKYLVLRKDGRFLSGRIVETEAYVGPRDPASHAFKGKTRRNEVMFGQPGHAYVYLTYGMHHCLNLVTERKGYPAAVLIRALEPADGVEWMKKKRKRRKLTDLASGPAKLCQALGIGRETNGVDLCGHSIYVQDRGKPVGRVTRSSRIGISEGKEKLWRFFVDENKYLSR